MVEAKYVEVLKHCLLTIVDHMLTRIHLSFYTGFFYTKRSLYSEIHG